MNISILTQKGIHLNYSDIMRFCTLVKELARGEKHTFYLFGFSRTDLVCLEIINELKRSFGVIETVLISMPSTFDKGIPHLSKLYDRVVFPPVSNSHGRLTRQKRIEWMINNSDYVVFCAKRPYGTIHRVIAYTKSLHIPHTNLTNRHIR